jgi:hypothetical protein
MLEQTISSHGDDVSGILDKRLNRTRRLAGKTSGMGRDGAAPLVGCHFLAEEVIEVSPVFGRGLTLAASRVR